MKLVFLGAVIALAACGDNIKPGGPGIELTHSTLFTTEGGETAQFTAVLSMAPRGTVTVNLSSSDLTEGTVSPTALTFTAENWNQPQSVVVTGVDDHLVDGARTYQIVTAPAISNDERFATLDVDDVSVTNTDDDVAQINVTPTTGLITTEAGGKATFSVVLTAEPAGNVTVGLSSSDTTEGTPSAASLVFTASNWNMAQVVTVTGLDDDIVDGDVMYTIVTAAVTSADMAFSGINPADVSVTNSDDDAAQFTITPLSGLVTSEAGDTDTFTIVLDSQPTADVVINLSSSAPDEGTPGPTQVTFTTANWDTPQVITVTGVDDFVDDDDQPYVIVTAAAVSSDPTFNGVNPPDVAAINTDDDTRGATVTPTTGLVTSENLTTATFTIALDSEPTADVTIDLSSSDLTEGTVSPSSVTFTPVNWAAAVEITVTGVDDPDLDGDIGYFAVTAAAVSADPKYSGYDAPNASVTNLDNEVAGILVTPLTLTTSESGQNAIFQVVLNAPPSATVTIPILSLDTSEGTTVPTSLTFTTSDWFMPQSVTVEPVDDNVQDGDITYFVQVGPAVSTDMNYSGFDADDVEVTNLDDDVPDYIVDPGAGIVVSEFGDCDFFTIRLTIQPSADVVIPVSSGDTTEGTVDPDSLTFTPANWDVPQVVTVCGVDDDLVDGHQTFFVVLGLAQSADLGYNGTDPPDVDVLNFDDETPGVYVQARRLLKTQEAPTGQKTQARIRLTIAPTADVTCTFTTSDPTEGVITKGATITFTPQNYDKFQDVEIDGVDDALVDGDVLYTLISGLCTSLDPLYNNFNPRNVTIINVDDD